MLDFRGYTPNEIARMSGPKASSAVMPSMVPMGSLASTPSFIFHQMQRQRKFIQTIHVRVEVVKNIKNAVAESKKGQAVKYEVTDRASR